MARETGASKRLNQTAVANMEVSTGNSRTKRNSIPVAGVSITLPEEVLRVMFQNVGATDIRLRINATGSDYWTIKPGERTPFILVNRSTLDVASVGSPSILECIFEG